MGAATAAILRLPLSAVVLATLLTVEAGTGQEPLIIVGVVVAYLVTLLLSNVTAGLEPADQPVTNTEPASAVTREAAVAARERFG